MVVALLFGVIEIVLAILVLCGVVSGSVLAVIVLIGFIYAILRDAASSSW